MAEPEMMINEIEALGAKLAEARLSVNRRFIGQERVVELVLTALLSGGHGLLVGLPGMGKTMLVDTLATVMGLKSGRVQFTPDLMPADILGSEVLEADEINRASPRTQSALLQAMAEREVTVSGAHRPLGRPFHVLATQNPIEQEGTYPLPEAQLDRFLLQIDVAYPTRETEREILLATTGASSLAAHPVFSAQELIAAQDMVRRMPVGASVVEAILDLVRACRPFEPDAGAGVTEAVAWGPGPRAAQALMLGVRARALIEGRFAPSLSDVAALAQPVLMHRMALNFSAKARGVSLAELIAGLALRATGGEAA